MSSRVLSAALFKKSSQGPSKDLNALPFYGDSKTRIAMKTSTRDGGGQNMEFEGMSPTSGDSDLQAEYSGRK